MANLAAVIMWSAKLWLVVLFGVIAYQLLTGQINTKGLLWGQTGSGNSYFSPERVQLLLSTLAMASYYLGLVLQNSTKLPDVDPNWIAALGGSHALYLGGKAYAMMAVGRKNGTTGGNKT